MLDMCRRCWYNPSALHAETKMKPEQQHAREDRQTRPTSQPRRSNRPGAVRMTRLRERRRRGFRVFQVEVCAADIDALVVRGLLNRIERDDADAVERAIGGLL